MRFCLVLYNIIGLIKKQKISMKYKINILIVKNEIILILAYFLIKFSVLLKIFTIFYIRDNILMYEKV